MSACPNCGAQISLGASPAGLPLVLDLMRGRVGEQWREADVLDSKANFTLTAATVLAAGFASYGRGALADHVDAFISLRTLAIGFSLALYLAMIVSVWLAHHARTFQHVPDPSTLLDYADKPLDETQDDLADAFRSAFYANDHRIRDKAAWLRRAERILLLESLWIALIVAWQSLA